MYLDITFKINVLYPEQVPGVCGTFRGAGAGFDDGIRFKNKHTFMSQKIVLNANQNTDMRKNIKNFKK